MIFPSNRVRIMVATKPVDFRKGHDGLAALVKNELHIRRAVSVHPVADVQIEYSLFSRNVEDRILPTCRGLGIAVTAYGVLSRGLLSGSRSTGDTDFRSIASRFHGDNLAANPELVENLGKVAERIGAPQRNWPSPGYLLEARILCRSSGRGGLVISPRFSLPATSI